MRTADFERLYAEHAQRLFGFLVYRTGDRALAEDLLSDTFEAAYRARRRFVGRGGGEAAWLYTIALNRLRDHHRRREVEERALTRLVPADDVGSDPAPGRVETRDTVLRALHVLSGEEREAVALRFGADLSLREIARALDVSDTTAEGRVYRALRKLRAELDPADEG